METSPLLPPGGPALVRRHSGRVVPLAVRSRQGHLGHLTALLFEPRLLLISAPQVPGGILLVPFEAIQQVDWERGDVLLHPARESLEHAGRANEGSDDAARG